MIKSQLLLCFLGIHGLLFGVTKKELADYLTILKSNPGLFNQEEESTLSKSINMLNNDASIWQLMGMRYALREVLNNKINCSEDIKCTCYESRGSYHADLKRFDAEIQTTLNHFVAEEQKQLCRKITAFTSTGFLLTYASLYLFALSMLE